MFNFIKKKLQKIYQAVATKLGGLLGKEKIDQNDLKQLEVILLEADVGVQTTRKIMQDLSNRFASGELTKGEDLKNSLNTLLNDLLIGNKFEQIKPVVLFVGINGSGKTTAISKLARQLKGENKKVLLAAADTFRAAATEQLVEWAKKVGVDIVTGQENQDPASVVYQACEKFKNEQYDYLIVDTAGRLQTKINLMNELAKIKRVIEKILGADNITTLLTVDAMLGQNSFEQAKIFNESTHLDGIILTKMDGTGKGGIVFAIVQELKIPVAYITFGENLDAIKIFDEEEYVKELLEK
ncbi:TPA: signal recognition particle-docking protein FtsY [Candidatus Dependentiae bacterium]|nr:MAG: Signal recognition particle receptor FtsY [candidate division TM6 bacterium GW2011_GWF2_36_131]KKQ03732.1 MAG: Signal recognition particle receptor FtsY [candidate division TM6 bacterium GW2011_GWE2_36_25]KKQ20032.1 MAG: Signal recognition particle receptor FtsY [candidate division TM6 bacterium GW2011_GWA2_36_9]HBR70499.1 signal recognition particle-docking protein FtsY [Candidatus Dependentiae bacterium]HCU00785.1 signal recognition particle-docking protein FtsY [Candidatus Dependenti